jgi:hypothetical protein
MLVASHTNPSLTSFLIALNINLRYSNHDVEAVAWAGLDLPPEFSSTGVEGAFATTGS